MDGSALGMIVLLLALMGGVAFAVRRFAGVAGLGASTDIHVVGARRIDLNTTLYIVVVDGRRMLLSSGREGARLVADLSGPTPPAG